MVSLIVSSKINVIFFSQKMSMSVLKGFLVVVNYVSTILEAIVVLVSLDINLIMITILVLVRIYLTLYYYHNKKTDINECGTGNGGCEQNCQNNIGTYSCSCLTGYSIDTNGHNCTGLINSSFSKLCDHYYRYR